MLPDIRQRMLERHGFEMQDYGDFSRPGAPRGGGRGAARGAPGAAPGGAPGRGADTAAGRGAARARRWRWRWRARPVARADDRRLDSTSGWAFSTYESLARYGTNYYGLRNRIAILSEAFSHDPFARRVASTYDFVSEILSYLAEHKSEIMNLGSESDAKVAAWARKPARRRSSR